MRPVRVTTAYVTGAHVMRVHNVHAARIHLPLAMQRRGRAEMAYQRIKLTNQDIECVDIPTMQSMSPEDYEDFLADDLLLVDHHDVLRSMQGGYPLATNKEQLRALIDHLKALEPKLPD